MLLKTFLPCLVASFNEYEYTIGLELTVCGPFDVFLSFFNIDNTITFKKLSHKKTALNTTTYIYRADTDSNETKWGAVNRIPATNNATK